MLPVWSGGEWCTVTHFKESNIVSPPDRATPEPTCMHLLCSPTTPYRPAALPAVHPARPRACASGRLPKERSTSAPSKAKPPHAENLPRPSSSRGWSSESAAAALCASSAQAAAAAAACIVVGWLQTGRNPKPPRHSSIVHAATCGKQQGILPSTASLYCCTTCSKQQCSTAQ
jgi:hypothetical protein